MHERALAYASGDAWLYGILSLPAAPAALGVVIVVGGPQYRAGSHRQFALLARELAAAGIPVLRFDYAGMGDSDGATCGFEHAARDIRASIDRFFAETPSLERVALWGLCDGATAAALYAPDDARVAGVALLNPWVRTEQGAARAAIRHYYRARLFDRALWRKIARGQFDWRAALGALWRTLGTARASTSTADAAAPPMPDLPSRMLGALQGFQGPVLLLLSGADLTAREFDDLAATPGPWRKLLDGERFAHHAIERADHTLSRREWHAQVVDLTRRWLRKL
ncbi:hydrolase 1, exosortase A system-associated [Telluria beijingensis]|uniref:hydrolase 1, exosortase A system-associated n=1 Tax=Telluria beijingensis TaxID=3068633 RepID=UPI0027956625|nr:hydrolase 1, exosortase A system-associated [Massilia sp. REN29]